MGADPRVDDARWLLDWISRTNQAQFTRRDAHSTAPRGRFPKATNLDPALALLEEHGFLRRVDADPLRPQGRPAALPAVPRQPLCTPPQNPHNPQNPTRRPVLWVLWVLWRVATPRGAADEGKGGCHVIQRERPQPLPAMSGVAPSRQRPPAALPVRLDGPVRRTPSASCGAGRP